MLSDGAPTVAMQAVLDHENEVRRALIRGLLAERAAVHDEYQAKCEAYHESTTGSLPDGFGQHLICRMRVLTNKAQAIAYDLASLSAGPGYFVRNEIQGWDVNLILEGIQI